MIDLQAYLEKKLRDVMSAWNEADIYAVSFFVYANETYEYNGYSNITQFSVSYNTERALILEHTKYQHFADQTNPKTFSGTQNANHLH